MSEYLSLRLKTIFEMIPENEMVADIGADHGKLMIALIKENKISHGYAVENKKGPYSRLVKALEKENIIDDVIPLYSDGLTDVPNYVKTIVIAGMGGNAIIDILKKNPSKTKNIQTLIIDAHSALKKVRQEISNMGFIIADEKIVKEDDIYYEIIKFIRADIAFYNDKELEFGPILVNEKSATFKEKYSSRIKEIDHLLENKGLPMARIEALKGEKDKIMGVLS